MGEFLGWLFQGVWAVAVAVLVLRAVGLPRWFGGLGLALAAVWAVVIPVAGLLRWSALNNTVGQPVYSLWFVWLLVLGVLLLRRRGGRRALRSAWPHGAPRPPSTSIDHDDPAGVRPRRPVPQAVAPLRLGHGLRVREHAGRPLEGQPAPPVHLATAARPPRAALRAFTESPLVMTRTTPASASHVKPTATTCGLPSARSVVSVARWRSREEGAGGVGGEVEGHAPRVPDPDGARGPARRG